jgi:hypothetical protein
MLQPLKGKSMKDVFMAEQYYTKTITFRIQICSSLKKNADPAGGGGHTGGLTANSNISANSFLYFKRP